MQIIPSFLVDKASFHCTHWHRFFPLKKAPPFSPSLSSLRKRGCNRPTVLNFLPLRLSCKESSTFSPSPSSSGSGDVAALRCSEPLRSKVGGPSKVFAILCGMGPPDYRLIPISYMLFSEFHYLSVNNFFPKFVQSSFIPVLYNLLFFCIREFDRTLLIYVEMQIR